MPLLAEALRKVGLELSITKTKITHIDDGFDFLGFHVRKYKNGKLDKASRQGSSVSSRQSKKSSRKESHGRQRN
jgi:RNA-directed DNA polymerase